MKKHVKILFSIILFFFFVSTTTLWQKKNNNWNNLLVESYNQPPSLGFFNKMTSLSTFSDRYYSRLKLDPFILDTKPTLNKLQQIVEAHISNIPFENLGQHGGYGGKQSISCIVELANKILDRSRGGFCFELNGLLGEFLEKELQYDICRVPAYVARNGGTIFNVKPTHMFLLCTIPSVSDSDDLTQQQYFVDVGYGEPAIHPLQYIFDIEQRTPDGMRSKITKGDTNDDDDEDVVILWWYQNNKWLPRLKWSHKATTVGGTIHAPTLQDFQPIVQLVQEPDSIFNLKTIVCLVNRTEKISLSGRTFKRTGPPRFPIVQKDDEESHKDHDHGSKSEIKLLNNHHDNDHDDPKIMLPPPPKQVEVIVLESDFEVRRILQEQFHIPMDETINLDLTKSLQADPIIWSQF